MARVWTDEQLAAITSRGKTLLVSAAAGSGKTATLTERVIRQLTDRENPVDITSMLVVTFTKAAAAELRAKIAAALEAAVRKDPTDARLERQLFLLPSAKIRTIDSFCSDVLRANCDRVGINGGYRIADTAECRLLADSLINSMIDATYEGELPGIASPEELEALADCLTDSKRTEELSEVLLSIHEKCESEENGIESLRTLIDRYDPEKFTTVDESFYGSYLMERVREMLDFYISALSRYERAMLSGGAGEVKYADTVAADLLMLRAMRGAEDYTSLSALISEPVFVRVPSVKKADKTDAILNYTELRTMMKEDLKKYAGYFVYTEDMWRELFSGLYSRMGTLYRFLRHFDALFFEEKRRRSAFSYADVERLCYRCLIKDGKPTDIAQNLAGQFSYVYIDEYQDVNALQNRIFEAVSREDNRFMVGDIKQSIYGFRSARPEIFAEMRASFPSMGTPSPRASLFMSKNFRCDRGIVDFVNGVFDKAFALVGESIGYTDSDRLEYGKVHDGGEPPLSYPKVYMLDKPPQKKRGDIPDEDDTDTVTAEAAAIAEKIRELLSSGRLDNGSPIKPSDIAIILRNAKNKAPIYAEALRAVSIPAEISDAKDFFLSPEVLLALCLLNSIDNPRRDIYLAGAMCSPLFSFDADDLYRIRSREGAVKDEPLYEALVAYVEGHPEYEKGHRFLDKLRYYRAIAEGVGVDTLLYKLYHETGLLALASAGGGRENLTVLYDYARSYESGAFKGLYNFINFVNNLIDKKTTFDEPRASDNPDAVRIVTCHGSKGLEYPVVFLANAGNRIVDMDAKAGLVYSGGFGIAFRLRTPSGLSSVDNPVREMIKIYSFRKMYEEELRVLYVALTRAREQLYCVGTCPKVNREEYDIRLDTLRENLGPYLLRKLSSYLEIILVTGDLTVPLELAAPASLQADEAAECERPAPELSDYESKDAEFAAEAVVEPDAELVSELTRRFTYTYPDPYLSVLPEKMSVSRASPTVLDGVPEGELIIDTEDKKRTLPAFMEGRAAEESAKRGIATHYFMQFCDLERLVREGGAAELSRLVSEGYISERDGERVRLDEIELFRSSELLRKMRAARKLYRELRFNVRMPAEQFTENPEAVTAYSGRHVLVQGVIDCIAVGEDGSVLLVDYKTDRLTREELADKALAERTLREKHGVQLSYYAAAVESIFGVRPRSIEVYSLPLGDTVDVDISGR